MARGRTRTELVRRVGASGAADGRQPDELIVEEPLAIHLDDVLVATTMRTPGNDYELAVGFCHTEGLLAGAPVTGVRYCATGSAVDTAFNVVTVDTAGRAPAPTPRIGTTSSLGGWVIDVADRQGFVAAQGINLDRKEVDPGSAAAAEVIDKRESRSRPEAGIVSVRTTGTNQHGTVVCTFERTILVARRGHSVEDKIAY